MRILIVFAACLVAGCGTAFKYNPQNTQSYQAIANNRGLEIAGAVDDRPEAEKRPVWSRNVEVIVARALADEARRSALFPRVKIHLSGPAHLEKFSYFIEFRVETFQMFRQPGAAEQFGKNALDSMGWRGALISASIPTTWESQVKVEFEVFDAATQRGVFSRTYSATRDLQANGYQGKARQIQQTSDCLEAVVQQFVGDLSLWANGKPAPTHVDWND